MSWWWWWRRMKIRWEFGSVRSFNTNLNNDFIWQFLQQELENDGKMENCFSLSFLTVSVCFICQNSWMVKCKLAKKRLGVKNGWNGS